MIVRIRFGMDTTLEYYRNCVVLHECKINGICYEGLATVYYMIKVSTR